MFAQESDSTPLFSIVIPARDEEHTLPNCLKSISRSLALGSETAEVIIVLNRCTDRTEEIARAHGCRIERNDLKNLAAIRNAGASLARGEYIVTVDADSVVSQGMFGAIRRTLAAPHIIGGGVLILPERWSLGILATGLMLLPIALRHRISAGLFFTRRADFHAIGGFDESLSSIEDIDFAKRLRAFGKSRGQKFVTLLRSYITTSCRKFDHFGDWYFVLRPSLTLSLLRGRNQDQANKVWYDFRR